MDFKDLNLVEMDKSLKPEEKDEWNAIYASYRSGSVITGQVIGVDHHSFDVTDKETGKTEKKNLMCLIIVKYRVKIIIPETEIWIEPLGQEHLLRSMCGAEIGYVITHIDRENGYAAASRKLALLKRRYSIKRKLEGKKVAVNVISVGKNICTVEYSGYDVVLKQRDISYSIVKDLREIFHPGDVKHALVTSFNAKDKTLELSIKALSPHPFDGVETRHPIGSTRIASIVGKYMGGVFCRLYDNKTDCLCSYGSLHYDGDFQIDDRVEITITKYNTEKRLVYGKILRKIY